MVHPSDVPVVMSNHSMELREAVQNKSSGEEIRVRDSDGAIYWIDSVDEDGFYFHADEGDTYRMSWSKAEEEFTIVE